MRGRGWIFAAAGSCCLAAALPAAGSDSGTFTLRLSVTHAVDAAPCLTVTPQSVDLGGNQFSAPDLPQVSGSSQLTVGSCSSSSETIYAHSDDAVGSDGDHWHLARSQSSDDNPCRLGTDVFHVWLHWESADVGLGLDRSVGVGVRLAPNSTDTVFFYVATPCEGSVGAGQTFQIPIDFTGVTS
jgi:hypothetical protein